MKYVPTIASVLLGLVFLMASVPFLLGQVPEQTPPPPGSAMAMYMGALGTTGYLKMVKVLELLGAILVMIPRTRNFGLLVLGPIAVNIVACWVFIVGAMPTGMGSRPRCRPLCSRCICSGTPARNSSDCSISLFQHCNLSAIPC